ncbi:pentatricopeptide repeat-containing protein 1, mitochondrial [Stegastes partitus]|uniref:Pentatricopeptide repeat-containing protein 1, mitochondrial-like n=1 Tax=Stegastes partitus TaxID=144197 RepID=A0A3B5A363_9TELE|nr:PREDICTED: pentatricopeptide repeat-containing protein 1, mitochondrial-like [Stegastes partitus]
MLSSVASSFVRNGRKISVPVSRLSILSNSPKTPTLTGVQGVSRHRTSRLLTPTPWQLPTGLSSRSVSRDDRDPPDSPSVELDHENFGSLSVDMASRRSFRKSSPAMRELRHQEDHAEEGEEEEEEEEEDRRRPGRRNTPYWYFLQCKKLIKENKLQEALDMFSRDMLKGERLQPEEFNYSVLIGGCGRAGQLKKAFKLYNDMKKRGLEAGDATYTALFNACAESPYKQTGLQQALKLEQELRRKNVPMSTITYHALLKTHAVTNHLQACIHTMREMLQNGHVVTQETLHYLLMGCLKDKEIGFRLALQVWRQMLQSGILPDTKNYNLLLRTARDCGIGDTGLASAVLLSDGESRKKRRGVSKSKCKDEIDIDLLERQLFLQPDPPRDTQKGSRHSEEVNTRQDSTHLIPVRQEENISLPVNVAADSITPNLLDFFEGKRGAVISLGTVDGACDRLALIGGADGFLEKMAANGLRPDLKTLTLLADTMEPGYQSLQVLLKVAKQHQLKPDLGFFNSVIHKAAKANDLEGAKAVLSVMRRRNVKVDIQTFGCLALGCAQQKDGLQLLKDIEEAGLRPNVHVFSALIGRASQRLDYVYLKTLLKSMRDMRVWPNEVIIRQLEFAAQYPPNYNQYKSRNNYLVHIDGFRGYYQYWLRHMPAQSAEDKQAALQSEAEAAALKTEAADLKTEAADGLTEAQKNQRPERRYSSRRRDKTSSTLAAL